jgi:hypothetical protein
MNSVSELIDKFGGPSDFGRAMKLGPSTASEMKRRQSIPVVHWPKLLEAAKAHGVKGIDYDLLVRLHSEAGS